VNARALHDDALATLQAWSPPTADQAALRERYVAHLESHPDGMTRSCRPDHLTASTVVLSHDLSHVLLTLHAKARQWFQLGGHAEPGDRTLAGAALREATEESGLLGLWVRLAPVHLDEHEVPFCGSPDRGDGLVVHHLDVRFLAVAPPGVVPRVSEESLDLRWWPVDDLPNPDLVELVGLARLDQSLSAGSNSDGGVISAAADHPSR
jgi:8-oxo-dGTP pyrophosphatase MutT (NUDIX family)